MSGYWSPVGNRIVLAERAMMAGPLVRHEMLHALVRLPGHPRNEFLERCGGVVVCVDDCITAAGPPPVPSAGTPRVGSDALSLSVEVNPPLPDGATHGGYFTITVLAHDPADHAVVVELLPSGDAGPRRGITRWASVAPDARTAHRRRAAPSAARRSRRGVKPD
ncbi:MAG TPA: hypothetical protein VF041_03225 [Gemmatimonadaceae bacterium]